MVQDQHSTLTIVNTDAPCIMSQVLFVYFICVGVMNLHVAILCTDFALRLHPWCCFVHACMHSVLPTSHLCSRRLSSKCTSASWGAKPCDSILPWSSMSSTFLQPFACRVQAKSLGDLSFGRLLLFKRQARIEGKYSCRWKQESLA